MRFSLIFLSLFVFLVSLSTWAKGKVTTLDYTTSGNIAVVNVGIDGDWDGTPALTIKDNIVQVSLTDAFVWPKIEKKIGAANDETTLTAYQFDKENVRVRAILDGALSEAQAKKVSVVMGNNGFELRYPITTSGSAQVKKLRPTATKAKADVANYDESYLEKLLEDSKKNSNEETKDAVKKVAAPSLFDEPQESASVKTDVVTSTQAAPEKEDGFKLDLVGYIGKFAAFLGLILAIFYGAVVGLRKGVFKKGKLNFLNSPKTIEVLNTTYIAPKRNMMVIRVGKQVFLVGSSENGLHMMGEIDAPAGLMKNEEESVTGTNFDLKLKVEDQTPREFNLKEDISKAAVVTEEKSNLGNFLSGEKDRVRLSDQIKTKVKSLKSLQ